VVSVKVADRDGSTTLGRILAGIDWTVRRGDRDGMNIRVLNLAFGAEPERSYRNDPLAFAVERAWDSGLAVVTSAGNGGDASESLDSPAYDPYVIAVGAEDSGGTTTLADDRMAPFSSRGSETRSPDVAAPGVAIVSTRVPGSFLDEAFPAARIGDGFRGSGTSQAAAVVSGATALLVGGRPSLVPDQVKALLRSTARPLPPPTSRSRAPVSSTSLPRPAHRPRAIASASRTPVAAAGCTAPSRTSSPPRPTTAPGGAGTAGRAIAGPAIAGPAIAGRVTAGRVTAGRATAGPAIAGRASSREGVRDAGSQMDSLRLGVRSWSASP
jgi:hypothetical protein